METDSSSRLVRLLNQWSSSRHWKNAMERKHQEAEWNALSKEPKNFNAQTVQMMTKDFGDDELDSYMGDYQDDFEVLRDLLKDTDPVLSQRLPELAINDPSKIERFAWKNAEIVVEIRSQLLVRLAASSTASPLDRAIGEIRELFSKQPDLKNLKPDALVKKCGITRSTAFKALRELETAGEYSEFTRKPREKKT